MMNPLNMLQLMDPDDCRDLYGRAMKMVLPEPQWPDPVPLALAPALGSVMDGHDVIRPMLSGFLTGPGARKCDTRERICQLYDLVGGAPRRRLKPRLNKKRLTNLAKLFRRHAAKERSGGGRAKGYLYFAENVKRAFLANKKKRRNSVRGSGI